MTNVPDFALPVALVQVLSFPVADGKPRTTCSISEAFDKLLAKLRPICPDMPKFTYYQFRGTSASLIYNEPQYRMYHELFLAHAPRSIAERHYVDPDIIDQFGNVNLGGLVKIGIVRFAEFMI